MGIKIVERLAFVLILMGSIGLFLSMLFGVADVVGSYFNRPVPGSFEVTGSAVVLIVFGGLAYAQIKNQHLRVELIYLRAGPKMRSVLDMVAQLSAIVFFGLLTWQGFQEAMFSWELRESTYGLVRFPLYPARALVVIGAGLLLVQLLLDFFQTIRNFGEPRNDIDPAISG